MIQIIAPIIAIIIAAGAFFGYIDPTYENIKETQADIEEYDQALVKSRELEEVRDDLLIKFNQFNEQKLERLKKILPDNVDSVRLIMDIDSIASRYGLTIRDFQLNESSRSDGELPTENETRVETTNLSFKVTASYQNFIAFMEDLEKSLRLVDVTNISFNASDINLYEFEINLRTYWLR